MFPILCLQVKLKKMNKKLLCLFIALSFIGLNSFSQTTTGGYNFSAFSSSYSSISSTGTSISSLSTLDYTQPNIPIGFTFTYCGTSYTQLSMSTKGWVSLANTSYYLWPSWWAAPGSMTSLGGGVGFLFAYWEDLNGAGHTAYYTTTGTAPNRVFTVEWNNWGSLYAAAASTANIQIKL